MIIKQINLKNYRVHKEAEINLDKGINLIIGKNGQGKSSFLEAAGMALFNAKPRTNNNEVVTIGEKSAVIKVVFEGNDTKEYIVERKIGTSSYFKLYKGSGKKPFLTNKDEIYDYIKNLAGIKNNADTIYTSIITAEQNKIVDIFIKTSGEREKEFNKIFDTYIYREMYDGYLKKANDLYLSNSQKKQTEILTLENQISDTSEDEEQLERLKNQISEIDNKIKQLSISIEQDREVIAFFDSLKNRISSYKKEKQHKEELLNHKKSSYENYLINIKEAEKSLLIVNQNRNNYEKYGIITEELKKLDEQIRHLEEKKQERDNINSLLNMNETKKEANNAKKQELEKYNVILKEDSIGKLENINQINSNIIDFGDKLEMKKTEGQNFKEKLDNVSLAYKNIEDLGRDISELDKLLSNLNLGKDIDLINQLKSAEDKLIMVEKDLETKKELEKDSFHIVTRLDENKNAKEKLGLGVCPFLKEECLNLKEKGNTSSFFEHREEELKLELGKINRKLDEFSNKEQDKSDIIRTISQIKYKIEILEKEKIRAKEFTAEKLEKEKAYRDKLHMLKEILNLSNENYDNFFSILKNNIHDMENVYYNLRSEYSDLQSDKKNQELNKLNYQKEYEAINEKLKNNSLEIEKILKINVSLREKNDAIKKQINEIDIQVEPLVTLKEERIFKVTKQRELEKSYNAYVSNNKKASELEKLINESKVLESDINIINKTIEEVVFFIKEEEKKLDDDKELLAKNTILENISTMEEKQKIKNQISSELGRITNIIENNNSIKQNVINLKKESEVLRKKSEIVNRLRDNLKSFGKFVASKMIKEVEPVATSNYRDITGRNEHIIWENSEGDFYQVYLCKGEGELNKRRFEVLSGGEQIAVSIAIRTALSSLFTTSGLAIFDEPTINLDSEKREALSDALTEMLKSLKQAIIVTHDDTFSGMEQKLINL